MASGKSLRRTLETRRADNGSGSHPRWERRPQPQCSGGRGPNTSSSFKPFLQRSESCGSLLTPQEEDQSEKWTSCLRAVTSCCRQLISPASVKMCPAEEAALPSKTTTTTTTLMTGSSPAAPCWIYSPDGIYGERVRQGAVNAATAAAAVAAHPPPPSYIIFYEPCFTFEPPTVAWCNPVPLV